jgi:MYXO-CTERM domain-containing protein
VLALAVSSAPALGNIVVYDNTLISSEASRSLFGGQFGDQVLLGSGSRDVIGIDILMGFSGAYGFGTADFEVRLYENDGLGGRPGTVLFDEVVSGVRYGNRPSFTLSVDVPRVMVPDTLTWTVEVLRYSGDLPAIRYFDPATIGSSDTGFVWAHNGMDWHQWDYDGVPANFGAMITTAPVPGAAALALLGLGLVYAIRRRL